MDYRLSMGIYGPKRNFINSLRILSIYNETARCPINPEDPFESTRYSMKKMGLCFT